MVSFSPMKPEAVPSSSTRTAERIALVASSRVTTRSSSGPCGSHACFEPSWNRSMPGSGRRARFLRCAARLVALLTSPRARSWSRCSRARTAFRPPWAGRGALHGRWYGASGEGMPPSALSSNPMECPMPQPNDLSRSLAAFDQDSTLIAVIEMSQSNWLVAGLVPGIERQPLKKLSADKDELLKLVQRWRNEATQAGREIKRIVVAYEAGRDGFWLARWLRRRGIEAYVIHPSSVAVSREHRRAKTDRLDTELLMRAFLGWLRGEKRHCSMAAIPTIEDEDAKRPSREHEKLVGDRTRLVNRMKAMLARFGIRTFKPTLRRPRKGS